MVTDYGQHKRFYSQLDRGFSIMAHAFVVSIIGVLLKQLRLLGDSFGFFELLGLITSAYFITAYTGRLSNSDVYFAKFMLIVLAAFGSGALISALIFPEHFSLRDLVATIYISLLVLGWISFCECTLEQRICLLRNYLVAYCTIVLIIGIAGFPQLKLVWYFGAHFGRLMGLSDNPNQLAGLANAGIVLCASNLILAKRVTKSDIFSSAILLLAGVLSMSVTFILSITLSCIAAFLAYGFLRLERRSLGSVIFNFVILSSTFFGLLALILTGEKMASNLAHLWSGETAKGATRFAYWIEALIVSLWSPLVGLGPGGHVQVEHSPLLQEAHNIFIEMFLSGGVIALTAYMFMLATIATIAWREKSFLGIFCLFALVVMGSFHTVLRHAHYWIALHAVFSALIVVSERRSWCETERF